jgi:hypothetical protein
MYGLCKDVNTGEWRIEKNRELKESKPEYCGGHHQETTNLGRTRLA